jgi:hypothetical protein
MKRRNKPIVHDIEMSERTSLEKKLMKEYTRRQCTNDNSDEFFWDPQSFTETKSEIWTCSYNMCFETMSERTIRFLLDGIITTESYIIVIAIQDFKKNWNELTQIRHYMAVQATNLDFCVVCTENTQHEVIFVLVKNSEEKNVTIFCDKLGSTVLCMCIEINKNNVRKRLCVLAVYFKAGQDPVCNPEKPCFLSRFRELYSAVHECNTWWKTYIVPSNAFSNKEFMDFNCLIIGDMNSKLIPKMDNLYQLSELNDRDEMDIILPKLGLREIKRRFRKTYKLYKENHDMYESSDEVSWSDRVFYHNGDARCLIQAAWYGVIENVPSSSVHLPIVGSFNLIPRLSTCNLTRVPVREKTYESIADRQMNPYLREPSSRPYLNERPLNRDPMPKKISSSHYGTKKYGT